MACIPAEVLDVFNKVDNVVFATADAQGQPNASIVGVKSVVDDETIYLSDQFFNKTLANMLENKAVSVVFWQDSTAYQIHGSATYVNEGEEFEKRKAEVDARFAAKGMPITAKGGVFIHVDAVYSSIPGPTAGDKIA